MQDRPVLSSLFVDFDNIFTNLQKQDPKIAQTFVNQPEKWLGWLDQYLQEADGRKRRIAVRNCYLNPRPFGDCRPFFMKAGFEVIDCPPLTSSGKTSADVRIVIDMLELADFKTPYEEFILLSADADFTPVLLKLRKRGCSTALLAVGNSSPMYRGSCDNVIDTHVFITQALIGGTPTDAASASPWAESTAMPDRAIVPPLPGFKTALTGSENEILSRQVKDYVRGAPAPVTGATLAAFVRRVRPDIGPPDWAGYTSFKSLLSQLFLTGLEMSTAGPGYLYDPEIHVPPAGSGGMPTQNRFMERYPELAPTVMKVSSLTDIPALTPEQYECLFASIAEEINKNGYSMTPVSKAVRDQCKNAKLDVPRSQVNWVLSAITYSGYRLGAQKEQQESLAKRYYDNALNLCEKSLLELTPEELSQMYSWLVGKAWSDASHSGSPQP